MQFDRKKQAKPVKATEDSKQADNKRRTRERKTGNTKQEDDEVGIKSTRVNNKKEEQKQQVDNQEQPELLEKDLEEDDIKVVQAQEQAQKVTWDDTHHLDQNQEVQEEQKPEEKEEAPKMASWVPQQNKKQQDQGANLDDMYMPDLDDPNAIKNAPKVQPKIIQKGSDKPSAGRPRFINSNKDAINNNQPIEMSLQQKKEMEMEAKLQKNYSNAQAPTTQTNTESKGPIKFTNSGNTNSVNNNAPIQLTQQQLKEMEAEEKLKKTYNTSQQDKTTEEQQSTINFQSGPLKFTNSGSNNTQQNQKPIQLSIQQQKELEAEARINRVYKGDGQQQQETSDENAKQINFKSQPFKLQGGANKQNNTNNAPIELTLQQKKELEAEERLKQQKLQQENNKEEIKTQETQERPKKFGFTNSKKQEQTNLQPIELTEQQKKLQEMEQQMEQKKLEEREKRDQQNKKKGFTQNGKKDSQKHENKTENDEQSGWQQSC